MEHTEVPRNDGGVIGVRRSGAGVPLLCIAGGPGRDADYLENLGGLSDHRELIMVDARGTGRSSDVGQVAAWRVTAQTDDVARVIDALDLGPVDLLGHSAGCSTALLVTAAYPQMIRSLVLVTPSPRGVPDATSDVDRIRKERQAEPLVAAANAARAELFGDPDPARIPALVEALTPSFYGEWTARAQEHAAAEAAQVNPTARAEFYDDNYSLEPHLEALGRFGAPTLVLTGSKDCATGVAVGERISSLFIGGSHRTLTGCGHFPWVDEPEDFVQTLEQFFSAP